ncbi:glycosyltransferase family 4 protein [Sphingomonas arantia]|uniref:Glycosyltransferase family 4 protein n=1 Tax=Sphingomonas arantia TaxID=1460676 RepID=A0ABW4U388_9SPHN
MTLSIGIDGYNLALPGGTGVATYGLTLAHALRAMGHETVGLFGLDVRGPVDGREVRFFDTLQRPPTDRRKGLAFAARWTREAIRPFAPIALDPVPLTDRVDKAAFADSFPRFDRLVSRTRLFGIAHRHYARTGRFVTVRTPDPPQIMHWTYPVPITLEGARNVYTIHDIVPLKFPHATLDHKAHYQALLRDCIARADHICTVSDASRRDLLEWFPLDPARVTNTYQALPPAFRTPAADPAEDAAIVEGSFGLRHRGYFLFYGAVEPKKNVQRLIEAYLSTRSATPLVIVGRPWGHESARQVPNGSIPGVQASPAVMQIDYLPQRMLLRLIRGARAVSFPSLYEGFGLPVLEAMALGTPVLSSTAGAIPEVTGDAALLVDPHDISAIAEGLKRLDGDDALRAHLAAEGKVRAELFSDAAYRDRLAALYAKVMV